MKLIFKDSEEDAAQRLTLEGKSESDSINSHAPYMHGSRCGPFLQGLSIEVRGTP